MKVKQGLDLMTVSVNSNCQGVKEADSVDDDDEEDDHDAQSHFKLSKWEKMDNELKMGESNRLD